MRDIEKIQTAKGYFDAQGTDKTAIEKTLIYYGLTVLKLREYDASWTEPDDAFYLWAYDNAIPICFSCSFWRDKAWTWQGWGICDNPANSVKVAAGALIEKFCIPDEEIKRQILHSIRYPENFGCRFYKRQEQNNRPDKGIVNLSDLEAIEAAKVDYDTSFGTGIRMVISKTWIHSEYALAVLKLEPEEAFAYARKAVLEDEFHVAGFYAWYYKTYMEGQPE